MAAGNDICHSISTSLLFFCLCDSRNIVISYYTINQDINIIGMLVDGRAWFHGMKVITCIIVMRFLEFCSFYTRVKAAK